MKTDLSIAIPLNTYARIAPRSGLAVKNFIDTGAGVVDYDYRGPVGEWEWEREMCYFIYLFIHLFIYWFIHSLINWLTDLFYLYFVGVVLFNHSEQDFEIKRGDRIAQLILERICMADILEVEELSSTDRGSGGFGSTGVSA